MRLLLHIMEKKFRIWVAPDILYVLSKALNMVPLPASEGLVSRKQCVIQANAALLFISMLLQKDRFGIGSPLLSSSSSGLSSEVILNPSFTVKLAFMLAFWTQVLNWVRGSVTVKFTRNDIKNCPVWSRSGGNSPTCTMSVTKLAGSDFYRQGGEGCSDSLNCAARATISLRCPTQQQFGSWDKTGRCWHLCSWLIIDNCTCILHDTCDGNRESR